MFLGYVTDSFISKFIRCEMLMLRNIVNPVDERGKERERETGRETERQREKEREKERSRQNKKIIT
jgi:hypothetical protein